MNIKSNTPIRAGFCAALLVPLACANAQSTPDDEEEIFTLSPFEVTGDETQGYNAATTLAGNRLSTELRDIGSAVSVVTKEFLNDVGATDNSSLLQYTTGTEVGGTKGNFAGLGDASQLNEDTISPNQNTRVRGLAEADNTRDFFRSDIPWDSYNVERVDLQRGANSILFGQGSPAGIINAGLKGASFDNSGQVELRFGSYGTIRSSFDLNRVILEDELAVRVNALYEDEKYKQDQAFSEDQRLYAALRYEPKALNRNGSHAILKANFESGNIDSNNPRFLPPADAITPWFTDLNQATYNQFQAYDHLSGRANHGQSRVNLASGPANPAYEPVIGNFGFPAARPGPAVFFDGSGQSMYVTDIIGAFVAGGIGPDGNVDGGIDAIPDNGWVSLQGTGQWAINANAPYSKAGLWKNNLITDPSIFDFYNNLIDGDSKREWQDFSVTNISFSQTFLENTVGYSIDYNAEQYENGQKALLPGEVRLQIDPMAVYGDGTPDAGQVEGGEPYANGTPNPNVGRPFVSSNNAWSNRSNDRDREALRATAFVEYDFDKGDGNWLGRILGTHTATGFLGKETLETDARAWQRYGIFDDAFYTLSGRQADRFNAMTPVQMVYLGDSLLGRSMQGANIPVVSGDLTMNSGSINYFDSTWNSSVDPAAPWINGFYLPGSGDELSTQSENPANYVGWTSMPLSIVDVEASAANRDRLTTSAALNKAETESQALILQSKWLDRSIVTTYGWRKDDASSWAFSMTPNDFDAANDRGAMDLSPSSYKLPSVGKEVEVQSRSYGIVAHVTDIPGLREIGQKLPVELSLYYNQSTNFKPDSSRVDLYGLPHPAPSGKTVDKGIRLETRDGRYSLRVNHYETTNSNASSTQINAASIGNWMQLNQNFANVFEYNILPWGYDASQAGSDTDVFGDDGLPMRYNYHRFYTDELAAEPGAIVSDDGNWVVNPNFEHAVLDAVRAFQRSVDPRFYEAWGINTFGDFGPSTGEVFYSVPDGFTIIEDNVSEGWEYELSAQPTDNWRISFNASKTDARRLNVGNENIREFMNLVSEALSVQNGLGRMHHYWGTEDVVTAGKNWYDGEGLVGAPGSEWRLAQLVEGATVPELREWRMNLVTNYAFDDGRFSGLNLGGGVRYQSSVIIAYPPTGDPNDPTTVEYDLDDPIEGPSETNYDLWVGYGKTLSENLDWRIQLNVSNAFSGGDDLIPITAQPDGTFAAYRIAPTRTWSISNTFSF
ncbi:TonB-dependent receptor plug domain-containing protein [Pelagicoccus sp. SDUM812003]|uniref:TonB-dependent receptor plug domain-containing protein n=1 Tax=Pelagicoccus sp. SDUM812003 TaxID=3041267 RepID=UPI00280EB79A|nr:TonB-dependent receptor plug domain-containing protein [Pelagicoccus sp. SDUM812003]MDQ8204156.1 TonB-dependent receptor plug domain-containing protein [Pelagicoccus sp. SDUM812003]